VPYRTDAEVLGRLASAQLVRWDGERLRPGRRWQAAMMRAAQRLIRSQETRHDLRVPVISALLELFGDHLPEDELVACAAVMVRLSADELMPDQGPRPA